VNGWASYFFIVSWIQFQGTISGKLGITEHLSTSSWLFSAFDHVDNLGLTNFTRLVLFLADSNFGQYLEWYSFLNLDTKTVGDIASIQGGFPPFHLPRSIDF